MQDQLRSPPPRRRQYHAGSASSTISSSYSSSSSTSSDSQARSRKRRRQHRSSRCITWTESASVACAPPIGKTLRRKIRKGEFINFDKLLLDPQKPPPLQNPKQSKSVKTTRQVADLSSWLEAWNRYLCTRVACHPAMALELVKYQTLIIMFFSRHYPQQVVEYDKLFRQAAALDQTIRWDSIKEDIYVWALTQRSNFRPISARLGPPPGEGPATRATSDKASHTSAGKEICKRYNIGKCIRGEECVYAHVCWHPGCQGQHPGKGCPKKG